MGRRHTRIAAWLAALAVVLQALWPLIAQAKPRGAVELVPVCTVEGKTHFIELPAGKTPLDEQSSKHHDHCAFCFFSPDRAALPAQVAFIAPVSSRANPLPPEAAPLARSVLPFSTGKPRAPPPTP